MSIFKEKHRDALNTPAGYRHPIHNWEFDDAAAREAESIPPTADNLKNWALQLDDNSLWMLTASVEDTENPGTYITTWKGMGGGGNSRAGYTYFGLRCNSVAYPGNSATLSEAQFFTSSGLLLPLFATTGTTVGLFNGSAPDLTLPFVLYTQSNTAYTNHFDIRLEDIDAFRIYTNYGEYGAFKEFDLIASHDGETWVTVRSYVSQYIQGAWQSFYIKPPIYDFTYPDKISRVSEVNLSADDLDRIVKQTDDSSLWRCLSVSSGIPTWERFGSSFTNSQILIGDTLGSIVTLTTEGGAPSLSNQIILKNYSRLTFMGMLIAQGQEITDSTSIRFDGCIRRGEYAETTVLEASHKTYIFGSFVDPYGLQFAADTIAGGLHISMETPETNYHCVCKIDFIAYE